MRLRHVSVRITDACNLKCEGCYVIQNNNYMNIDDYRKRILPSICELGAESVGFTGGEPLMHEELWRFVDATKSNGLTTSVVTNGVLLDGCFFSKLATNKLDRLQITLNYLEIQKNTTREYIEHERLVSNTIPKVCDTGVFLTLVAVPNYELYDQLEEYVKYAIKYGVDAIYFRRKIVTRTRLNEEISFNKKFLNKIIEVQNRYKNYIRIMSGDPLFGVMKAIKTNVDLDNLYSGCSAGITSLAIGVEGNIYPCTRINYSLGNIYMNNLRNIWDEDEVLLKLRKREIEGRCSKCYYKLLCGGCRAEALVNENNIFAQDSLCDVEKF